MATTSTTSLHSQSSGVQGNTQDGNTFGYTNLADAQTAYKAGRIPENQWSSILAAFSPAGSTAQPITAPQPYQPQDSRGFAIDPTTGSSGMDSTGRSTNPTGNAINYNTTGQGSVNQTATAVSDSQSGQDTQSAQTAALMAQAQAQQQATQNKIASDVATSGVNTTNQISNASTALTQPIISPSTNDVSKLVQDATTSNPEAEAQIQNAYQRFQNGQLSEGDLRTFLGQVTGHPVPAQGSYLATPTTPATTSTADTGASVTNGLPTPTTLPPAVDTTGATPSSPATDTTNITGGTSNSGDVLSDYVKNIVPTADLQLDSDQIQNNSSAGLVLNDLDQLGITNTTNAYKQMSDYLDQEQSLSQGVYDATVSFFSGQKESLLNVAQQNEDNASYMNDLQAEESKAQYDYQLGIMRDNNSRYEGYLKGKFAAAGMLDSGAGLLALGKYMTTADMNLAMTEKEADIAQRYYLGQSRDIMTKYFSDVMDVNNQTNQAYLTAQSNLISSYEQITQSRITSEQKQNDDLLGIYSKAQDRNIDLEKFSWQRTMDITNAGLNAAKYQLEISQNAIALATFQQTVAKNQIAAGAQYNTMMQDKLANPNKYTPGANGFDPVAYQNMINIENTIGAGSGANASGGTGGGGNGQNLPTANNNPGDIELGSLTIQQAQQQYNDPNLTTMTTADGRTFLKFSSPEKGFAAMGILLNKPLYANQTVDSAMRTWSGNSYGGAEIGMGSIAMKTVSQLTPDEKQQLIQAMAKREGYQTQTPQSQTGTQGSQPTTVTTTPSSDDNQVIQNQQGNTLSAYKETNSDGQIFINGAKVGGDDKNAQEELQALAQKNGYLYLDPGDKKANDSINGALDSLNEIAKLINIPGVLGDNSLGGLFKRVFGNEAAVHTQIYDDLNLQSLYDKVGNLSESINTLNAANASGTTRISPDILKGIQSNLPDITDTVAVANNKLTSLTKYLKQAQNILMGGKADTSNLQTVSSNQINAYAKANHISTQTASQYLQEHNYTLAP